jgi:hypothetical protein
MSNQLENEKKSTPTINLIGFCSEHHREISMALTDRHLDKFCATDNEELEAMLRANRTEPMLELGTELTRSVIHLLGAQSIQQHEGCPLCTLSDIVGVMADRLASRLLRIN